MISHTRKFVYVHIAKVAGTSISATLKEHGEKIEKETGYTFPPPELIFEPPPPHLPITGYRKYGYLSREQYSSYFKFSFVRNPWDRIVSEYKYRRYSRRYSFKHFILNHLPKVDWSDAYCHIIPQYNFLYSAENKLEVDFIGKFENIQADFKKVCVQLELPAMKLKHSNKSQSLFRRDSNIYEILRTLRAKLSIQQKRNTFSHYTEYYDNETIEIVGRLYKNDVTAFGYEFGQ